MVLGNRKKNVTVLPPTVHIYTDTDIHTYTHTQREITLY